MRDAMLAVHKSEYSAQNMNVERTQEEVETAKAAKALVNDLGVLRDYLFALMIAEKALYESNSNSNPNQDNSNPNLDNSHHTSNNKPKGSIVDD